MRHEATLVTVAPANPNEMAFAAHNGGTFAVDVVTVHVSAHSLEALETAVMTCARELRDVRGCRSVIELAGTVPKSMVRMHIQAFNDTQGNPVPFHPALWPGFVRYVPE